MERIIRVNVTYTFKGYYIVRADTAKAAAQIVDDNCSMTLSNGLAVNADESVIPDWNIPVHPETEITGVSYEQDKPLVIQLAK